MNDDDETLWLIIAGILLLIFAPGILGSMFTPVQAWLVEAHVLVRQGVMIPIGTGSGLDLTRVLIVTGVLLLAGALAVVAIRQQLQSRRQEARR